MVVAGLAVDDPEDRDGCAEGDAVGRVDEDPVDCLVDGDVVGRFADEVPFEGFFDGVADGRVDEPEPLV